MRKIALIVLLMFCTCGYATDISTLNKKLLTYIQYQSPPKMAIEHLLAKGANVNAQDTEGYSVLHYAVKTADIELVQILLKAGAKVDIENQQGLTPLVNAVFVYPHKQPATQLKLLRIVELLQEKGADINHKSKDGEPVLYYAYDNFALQNILVNHGAIPFCDGHRATYISAKEFKLPPNYRIRILSGIYAKKFLDMSDQTIKAKMRQYKSHPVLQANDMCTEPGSGRDRDIQCVRASAMI